MNVLMLSTYYMHGGAGRSAARLHEALTALGVEAHMLVRAGLGDSGPYLHGPRTRLERAEALLKPALEKLPLMLYPQRNRLPFAVNLLPGLASAQVRKANPDVVNLHWVNDGFVRIETLSGIGRPIVLTLHDSWAFTGGCHIPLDCRRYTDCCGRCPALGSDSEFDLSRWTWRRKARAWRGLPLTLVTPSRWLARCARESSLFRDLRIEVIPNGLDIGRVPRLERETARRLFGLRPDKKYLLFGAVNSTSDRNKGYHYLEPALNKLAAAGFGTDCEVIVFGSTEPPTALDFGLKTHYLGCLHDELTLSLLYTAADLFVAPSMQENLPNTIMEAMACGTPCVAFDVGGIPDLIDHRVNGYLAAPFNAESLAEGMVWVLRGELGANQLADACRTKIASCFDIVRSAQKYLELFQEVAGPVPGSGSRC